MLMFPFLNLRLVFVFENMFVSMGLENALRVIVFGLIVLVSSAAIQLLFHFNTWYGRGAGSGWCPSFWIYTNESVRALGL